MKSSGFTLIELLVVVLIIGILTAVALPQYEKAVRKARVMRLLPLVRAIAESERLYELTMGHYSLDFSLLDIDMPAGATTTSPSQMSYSDFTCGLYADNQNDPLTYSIFCNDAREGSPQLERYFAQKHFICWGDAGQMAMEICQDMTGVDTPTETNEDSETATGFLFE